jgi:hypothetical protein
MKVAFHKPQKGKTYKIISPSKLLHERFGENLEIRIVDKAHEIYGNNFMDLANEGACRFYVTRLDEIPHSYGEVYAGRIGLNYCLVNVSELDFTDEW